MCSGDSIAAFVSRPLWDDVEDSGTDECDRCGVPCSLP